MDEQILQTERSVKLGKMPINKLIWNMSLPAMLSMLVQALYNIVDSIFLSFYSQDALDAVNLAFPMQVLMTAFAIGLAIGTNSLIARKLGEGRADRASDYAKTGLIMAAVNALIFVVVGLTLSGVFSSFYANNERIAAMAKSYLIICLGFSFGIFLEIMLTKILQATGNMIIPMFSQLIGAVANIILDPILIFGYLGFPAMGIKGAAIATVVGQIAALIFVLIMFIVRKHDVSLSFKCFRLKIRDLTDILRIGMPSIVLNAIGSFTLMAMNAIVKPLSENSITILGLYFKVQSFVFMPVFGLNQGLLPIMAYNFGAGNRDRFTKAYKSGLKIAVCIMLVGVVLFMAAPGLLLKMFNAGGSMLTEGKYVFRVLCLCFIPAAFNIISITMFQSVGKGVTSLILSLSRQLGLLLPLAFLLRALWKFKGVWFAYPIAELVVLLIFIPVIIRTIKGLFKQSPVGELYENG